MEEERERYEQPDPGAQSGEGESDLPEQPEVEEVDDEGTPREQGKQTDQESKHSFPTSDPPSNY